MIARDIALRLGLRRSGRDWRGACPACGYAGTFSLTEREGRTLWWCASCQDGDAIARALGSERGRGAAPNPPNPPKRAVFRASATGAGEALAPNPPNRGAAPDHAAAARRLWETARPINGTTAGLYLAARGLAGFASPALRFLGDHRHAPSGTRWPTLVAAATDPLTGELRALHRTYLAPDGRHKAPVEPPKMTLGPTGGAVIRLAEPEAAKPLVIGEGIESAASAGAILAAPAWAAISAGNLSRIALPPAVREVVVAADNDPVGQREAERAAQRWQAEGRRARIAMPDAADTDFNDLLMRRRLAREAAHG
jgi:putative DNA primase/helicase